jgi:hypothetical protein
MMDTEEMALWLSTNLAPLFTILSKGLIVLNTSNFLHLITIKLDSLKNKHLLCVPLLMTANMMFH